MQRFAINCGHMRRLLSTAVLKASSTSTPLPSSSSQQLLMNSLRCLNSMNSSSGQIVDDGRKISCITASVGRNHRNYCTAAPAAKEDHSKIWNFERILSAGLVGVMPLSFMINSPAMDYLLAVSMVLHIHWGLEAVVVDYIRPMVFGPVIPRVSLYALYLVSILSLAGLFYFNYTDVGMVQGLRMAVKM
ncbi:succinate dehydrogenase, subunit D [Brevipalpus obovatus]|uniref:succinate dehydrogenase, subunit D n=1 Tax=Brevipalpus obovatus TaxID=246614 RepID=UPI003D9F0899